jgi:hypothetical protein
MKRCKVIFGAAGLSLAVAMTGSAGVANAAGPSRLTIKAISTSKVKINRYVQDGLRWDKDAYLIRSGGTLTVLNNAADEGPHTFTVAKASDLPRTPPQIFQCKLCERLAMAHGVDPANQDAPPQFPFLENGVGQATPPSVDRPGDSGITGSGRKGEKISMKVTAKRGSTLRFICLIHPWMQARLKVG